MRTYLFTKAIFSFCESKPVLYIFAGQGTQQKGMLNDLLKIDEARLQIKNLSQNLGIDFEQISTTDSANQMNKTKITQPLLVLSQALRFKYLNKRQLSSSDFMIGHSIGQYSALCIAKSIGLQQCLRLVHRRGQLMQTYTREPSGMLIVRFGNFVSNQADNKKQLVNTIVNELSLQIACYNTPNNINIAGTMKKLEEAHQKFKQAKITCLFLPVSAAFHCNLLSQMLTPFSQYLANINFGRPVCKVLRNLDTKAYQGDTDIKQGLTQHLVNPVKFEQSIKIVNQEIECIQIGHNQILKKFVKQTRTKMQTK